jgi:hypothetical protein
MLSRVTRVKVRVASFVNEESALEKDFDQNLAQLLDLAASASERARLRYRERSISAGGSRAPILDREPRVRVRQIICDSWNARKRVLNA